MVIKRVDQIGAPVAALAVYWSQRLSLTLQRNVTQAIEFRLISLYAGQVGPTKTDETITDIGQSHWVGPIKRDAVVAVVLVAACYDPTNSITYYFNK